MNLSGRIILGATLAVGSLAINAQAQDASGIKAANLQGADLELMNDHDPASEQAQFDLLPGYQVNLFAADPMFANPVHMQWDSRGRLWVACSWAYPQLKPGDVANDKIIILEDTDDDGAADKSTVFAEGLYLPTGIELANGGCYVAQSPDVFFLKDTDGDDIADLKELALTGFGIEDSHHSISAWRRGPDGWIYFQEGIFLHTQVETQHGVVRNFNGGVYQFNPRTQELRMFCTGTGGNPWGHVFDRWGQSFMVNNPRILHLSPWTGNSGEQLQVKPLISTDKQCGGDLATGSHVGDDLRGQLLTGRFKSRMVVRYELIDDGAGFSANVLEPLISCKHPNFRPVDVKIGPDGAVYVADWYNSIINHASHDFRDPRRDHDHGRIWRITHKERPLVQKPVLVGISIESLLDQLQSPEDWTRHQARKELSEREPDQVFAALEAWVDALDPNAPDYDHHLVEAMWACQNVERVSEKLLLRVLQASDGHARSAGARIIRYWHESLSDPIAITAKAAEDPFPRTRMEAVLSAGFIPNAEAFAAALHVLDHPSDPYLDLAIPQTMKALESHWRPALEAGTLSFDDPSHQEFVEQYTGIGLQDQLTAILRNQSPSEKQIADIQSLLLKSATDVDVRTIVAELKKSDGPTPRATTIALLETLQELAKSKWPKPVQRSLRDLKSLVDHDDETIALLAASNLGAWQMAGREEIAILKQGSASDAVAHALAIALAKTNPNHGASLVAVANEGKLATRYAALAGLAYCDLDRCVTLTAELLTQDPVTTDSVPLVQSILRQRDGAEQLLSAIKNVQMHPLVMSRVSEFHRQTGAIPPLIADLFQHPSNSQSLSEQLLVEPMPTLIADVDGLGDAAQGESIYRRKALACMNCHAIGPAGSTIGPNLVAVGAAAKTGYIVESMLRPNLAIAEHYENKMFLLSDGSIQTGIITFRNEKQVTVRDAAKGGQEVVLAVDEIELERAQPSAMPAGLADQLKDRKEFLDLAKFVSLLGKPGEYANDERPVIRKWRVLTTAGLTADQTALPSDEDPAWMAVYSKVNGELPLEDLPSFDRVFTRGYVRVLAEGRLKLDLNSTAGLSLWVDGLPVADLTAALELSSGRHALTFAVDTRQRDVGLRAHCVADDTTIRFQPEGGQ